MRTRAKALWGAALAAGALLSSPVWIEYLPEAWLTRTLSKAVTPSVEIEADYPFRGGGRLGRRLGRTGARAYVRAKGERRLLIASGHIAASVLPGRKVVLLAPQGGDVWLVMEGASAFSPSLQRCRSAVVSAEGDRVACLLCADGTPDGALCPETELLLLDGLARTVVRIPVPEVTRCNPFELLAVTPSSFLVNFHCSSPTDDRSSQLIRVRQGVAEPAAPSEADAARPAAPEWFPAL